MQHEKERSQSVSTLVNYYTCKYADYTVWGSAALLYFKVNSMPTRPLNFSYKLSVLATPYKRLEIPRDTLERTR